jgi:hypothetical protein
MLHVINDAKKEKNSKEAPPVGIPVIKQYTDIAISATVIDAEYIRNIAVILDIILSLVLLSPLWHLYRYPIYQPGHEPTAPAFLYHRGKNNGEKDPTFIKHC